MDDSRLLNQQAKARLYDAAYGLLAVLYGMVIRKTMVRLLQTASCFGSLCLCILRDDAINRDGYLAELHVDP